MQREFIEFLSSQLNEIKEQGLYKKERILNSPQGAHIIAQEKDVINLCANNYLGLANSRDLKSVAKDAIEKYGFGLSSVRFICGTQYIHKDLEEKISKFLGMEDTILYSSCFDANGGLFETLLGSEDAVISDSLNHASIIDGIRLCKANRFRYENNNMADLEEKLKEAKDFRFKMIATDGVFSMDGYIANLKGICDLAEKYGAIVMVDDSHAVGFIGENGRGTHEYCQVMDRVDIITGTLGKALGGASGGYTSGKKEIIDILRQRSRPYLFSNTLAPVIAATSIRVLDLLEKSPNLRKKLMENTQFFRAEMKKLGFNIPESIHPIAPVMLGDAQLAKTMAEELLKEGIYVIGFSFPVVPKGQARIRTQISAAHERSDLEAAIAAFAKVGKKLKVIR
ncbi:MAG: glycine C-acetyltransferase [Bacteriovoracales bacterium]